MKKLIDECKKGKQKARKELYHRYNEILMRICLRYSKNEFEAEDILMEGFMKIFSKIQSYSYNGSFEGWMKTIVVHVAIDYFRKNKNENDHQDIDNYSHLPYDHTDALNQLSSLEILTLIQSLPEGYRIVFNLFAIEGFSHKEIADKLQITESTSRSQLRKARLWLMKKMDDRY